MTFTSQQLREFVEEQRVVDIPWRCVRRFKGQPRTYFDPRKLRELQESIAEKGQETVGKVRVLWSGTEQQFELIDGERRLKVCSLLDRPFRALVEDAQDPEEQYEKSVRANLNRADHTPLEIARAVENIRMSKRITSLPTGVQIDATARVFSKSASWVQSYLSLARLVPDLRRLLEPTVKKKNRIPLVLAFRLSTLPRDEQLIQWKRITSRKLGLIHAQRLIDGVILKKGLHKHRRGRKPADEFALIRRFSDKVQQDAGAVLDMSDAHLVRVFTSRTERDRQALLQDLAMAAQAVDRVRQRLKQAVKEVRAAVATAVA
ncbi:MAG TPA: ParB N-terminal domain-containing protein [Candidatus Paceibacterota bacterium]|nr:ParB N-terminal domain-containing protein [Candidatus Paceibacterota bacterium]